MCEVPSPFLLGPNRIYSKSIYPWEVTSHNTKQWGSFAHRRTSPQPPGRSRQPLQIKYIKTMSILFNLSSVPFNVMPGFCRFLMRAKLSIFLRGHPDKTNNMPQDYTSNVVYWTVVPEEACFVFVTQTRKSYRVGLHEWRKKSKWIFRVSLFIFKIYARNTNI